MFSVPPVSSDPSHQSSLLPGFLLIAGVGLITELFHRYDVYQEKKRFREELRQGFGFHILPDIAATPDEISKIGKIKLKGKKVLFQETIRSGKPFQGSNAPDPIAETVHRLAEEIMDRTNASSVYAVLKIVDKNHPTYWHVDGGRDTRPHHFPNIRFLCTLRGPTTRFAELSLNDRRLFRERINKELQKNKDPDGRRIYNQAAEGEGVRIGPENTFSPKPGQVVAFCTGDSDAIVHAGPEIKRGNRVIVIFDLRI